MPTVGTDWLALERCVAGLDAERADLDGMMRSDHGAGWRPRDAARPLPSEEPLATRGAAGDQTRTPSWINGN